MFVRSVFGPISVGVVVVSGGQAPTEEEVREWREFAVNLNQGSQGWGPAKVTACMIALCDSWLAQRDVVARQETALREIKATADVGVAHHGQSFTSCIDAANRARNALEGGEA